MDSSLTPKITVLLPVYNGDLHLREAIQSILDQTFKNFEFLIINDGSTDQTDHIINSFADNRIVHIKNPTNQGIIACLNQGFDLAKGKFIARMDGDDISLPIRLQKQHDFLEQNPEIAILGSHFQIIDANGLHSKYHNTLLKHEELKVGLLFGIPFAHPTVMIRKEEFIKHKLYYRNEFKYAEDYDLWSRTLQILKGANYDGVLLKYRISAQQVSNKYAETQNHNDEKTKRNLLKLFSLTAEQRCTLFIFFRNGINTDQLERFEEICDALKRFIIINTESKILDTKILEQKITKKLDTIVTVYANAKNKLYNKYKKSFFFKKSGLSIIQKTKILLKQSIDFS